MNKQRPITIIVVLLAVVIIGTGYVTYFFHYNGEVSKSPNDWSSFATYQSYFVSVCSLLLLSYISYITYTTSKKFSLLQHRPYLVLTFEAPVVGSPLYTHVDRTYHVRNATSVPAINVLVRHKLDRKADFTKWVSCAAIAPNSSIEIAWVQFPDVIEICFSDIESQNYFKYNFIDSTGRVIRMSNADYKMCLNESIKYKNFNAEHLRTQLSLIIHKEIKVKSKSFNDAMDTFNSEVIKAHLL